MTGPVIMRWPRSGLERVSSLRDEHLRVRAIAKHIERLRKQTQHESGIGRGEHVASMHFEDFRRRARGLSRNIERPAQMLARMTEADLDTIEAKGFAIKRAHERKLLAERRLRFTFARCKIA